MRKDSCRKCGNLLETIQTCSFCEKPIQFHCKNCNKDSEEQIHFDCFKESFEKEAIKLQNIK